MIMIYEGAEFESSMLIIDIENIDRCLAETFIRNLHGDGEIIFTDAICYSNGEPVDAYYKISEMMASAQRAKERRAAVLAQELRNRGGLPICFECLGFDLDTPHASDEAAMYSVCFRAHNKTWRARRRSQAFSISYVTAKKAHDRMTKRKEERS